MKYLKKYELFLNKTLIKVDVLTIDELNELYLKLYKGKQINLKDKIQYFDYHDLNAWGGTDKHWETLRYITAYNDVDIIGLCKFAYWDFSESYAISYLSTNKDYLRKGVSKKMLDVLFKWFSETYPKEIMYWSGYSIDGWLYLRPTIKEMAKKYNVQMKEKAIEYITNWSDENRELFNKSREEINKEYNMSYHIY